MPPPRSLISQLLAQPTLLAHHPVLPLPRQVLPPVGRLHPRRARISPQLPLHLPPYDALPRLSLPRSFAHPGLPRLGLPRGLPAPRLPLGFLDARKSRGLLHASVLRPGLLYRSLLRT